MTIRYKWRIQCFTTNEAKRRACVRLYTNLMVKWKKKRWDIQIKTFFSASGLEALMFWIIHTRKFNAALLFD